MSQEIIPILAVHGLNPPARLKGIKDTDEKFSNELVGCRG